MVQQKAADDRFNPYIQVWVKEGPNYLPAVAKVPVRGGSLGQRYRTIVVVFASRVSKTREQVIMLPCMLSRP
jgi:hypothetical protein